MDNADTPSANDLASLTTDIVAAYISKNSVQAAQLPELIVSVHASLSGLGASSAPAEPETKASPAEIRKSIKHDALISFVDGRPYKTLKRHLTGHGLDAASYRVKYGLPHDYPMSAPSYSQARSALAKSAGLGQVRRNQAAPEAANTSEPVTEPAPKKSAGRPRKAKAA